VIDSVNLKQVGRHLPRPRSQRGELSDTIPKRGKLTRGRWWARWRVYLQLADGRESRRRAEKIIDRQLAEEMGLTLDYAGPLTKTDARKVLEKLIHQSNSLPASAFGAKTTFEQLAREYLDLSKPNWGANTVRSSVNLIEVHLIGRLGPRPVRELTDAELQRLVNEYVEKDASVSQLSKMTMYLRAILDVAVDRRLIERNPARKLKAKSRKRECNRAHPLEECDLLLSEVFGSNHLAIRLLVQLGLRPEETFALRRNDVRGAELVIDEAIVDGSTKEPKTLASAATMFVTPHLALELEHHLQTISDQHPEAWLFPSSQKRVPLRPANFLRRVLKPAAIRAGISLRKNAKGEVTTALNFQSLRRTASTLFGAKAKDPKSTQAHMRHADPYVTLRHYQQAAPAEVRAAALAVENDLLAQQRKRENQLKENSANLRLV
jgi:integrase